MYLIQNVSLRRDKFTREEAYEWIREHGYKPIKAVHVSPHFFQFRLIDPERLRGARFRTIDLGKVGHMIVSYI